jgi:hypothetical protein
MVWIDSIFSCVKSYKTDSAWISDGINNSKHWPAAWHDQENCIPSLQIGISILI